MKKIFLSILVLTAIYVLLLLIKAAQLRWKFRKVNENNLSFFDYLKRNEDFKNLIWILPIALLSAFLVIQFYNSTIFILLVCAVTAAYGVLLVVSGLKKNKSETTEEEIALSLKIKLTAGSILIPFLTAGYFWSRYFYKSLPNDLRPYLNLTLSFLLMLGIILYSRKFKKSVKSNPYFRFTSVYLILGVILVVLYWIYK